MQTTRMYERLQEQAKPAAEIPPVSPKVLKLIQETDDPFPAAYGCLDGTVKLFLQGRVTREHLEATRNELDQLLSVAPWKRRGDA